MAAGDIELSGEQDAAATWLAFLKRVITCGETIAQTARVKYDDAPLLAACLLARSISTAHAVRHLMGLGHVVEARMLTRSIFENEFYLYRLAGEAGSAFAREMLADEAYYHHARGQTMLNEEQTREAMGGEIQTRIQAIVKQTRHQSPNAAPLKPQNVISGTDISSASVLYQQLSSDAVHPSITALKRHFVESAGTRGFSLKPRIKDGEEMDTAFLASMALLIGCIAANDALGRTTGANNSTNLLLSTMRSCREREYAFDRAEAAMIRISPEAFHAIAVTMPLFGFEPAFGAKGERLVLHREREPSWRMS
jgi:hypothetical protein